MFIIQIRDMKFLGSFVSMKSISIKFDAIHSVHCRKYSCILGGLQSKNDEVEFQ